MTPKSTKMARSKLSPWPVIALLLALVPSVLMARAEEPAEGAPTSVQVQVVSRFFNPNNPEQFRNIINLMDRDPGVQVEMWSGLALPGGGSRTPIIMSIAGETSPDIMESWFHIIRSDIEQGFLFPLNEWIGEDTDGDGQISDAEAKWPGWKEIPELWRRVATVDGKVYGLPQPSQSVMGILFRTDMVRAAGLDPNHPPQTWDELFAWGLRLTDPGRTIPGRIFNPGQRAIALLPYGFTWLPWLQSAGGTPIKQIVTDPQDGKSYEFAMSETELRAPDGRDLSGEKVEFRADFDSPAGIAAAGFIHKLRWAPWILDSETLEPVVLTAGEVRAGFAERDGRRIEFAATEVQRGVGRAQSGSREISPLQLLGRGEVAMVTSSVSDIQSAGSTAGINPDLLSWFPFPAMDTSTPRVVQIQRHFATMVSNVRLRSPADRDKIWEVLVTITDRSAQDQDIERMVISGLARFVNPKELERLGLGGYLSEIPAAVRQNFRDIDNGVVRSDTEPFQGFWLTMDGALNREVLSLILAQSGEDFDYGTALRTVTQKANSGVMFERPQEELAKHRGTALAIFVVILLIVVALTILIIRQMMQVRLIPRSGMVDRPWLPWLMLLPALLLIGVWGYYPLLRGMVMAFQDYRIAGNTTFVGLDNFIALALDRGFWMSMWTTVYFVFLTMLLSFTTPIILAIMVSEVPRGKVFFRTLFFLPQVTSALVIALIWKMMYDPTPTGLFNQVITWLNYLPGVQIDLQSWLLDPKLAMFCVVLPTAWATAGIQSLIYLAALKSVPEELYEACEIDSGGIWVKLRHITLPVLLPLIIINFVGAFIGTFQNMGKIFLLTFGGPGEATMVVGMRIWIEAYNNLRFSMATSMAWVLGACLIGFTYIQIQFLKRIEFRKAKD
jgi:multiple sugar transport system permease protein